MKKNVIYKIYKSKVLEEPNTLALFDINRKLTRYELDKLSDTIAMQLPKNAKRVGIIMEHSAEMIAAIFATLKTGAAYVPVEPFFPKERIKFMMKESEVDFIITNSKYADIVTDIKGLKIDTGYPINFESCDMFNKNIRENDLAYILYTSGTTGKPK